MFFFNDTATTEIYTLSLHDALPISGGNAGDPAPRSSTGGLIVGRTPTGIDGSPRSTEEGWRVSLPLGDRKSTRLNSSHANISYAVFCLKKNNLSLRRL